MCSENEPDERMGIGRVRLRLEPHQLDAHGDPHVAYLRVMPGETVDTVLARCFRRFDGVGYCEEIAALGRARVAREEYRHLIESGGLDDRVSALELALLDTLGEVEGGIGVVTVDEVARQFVRLGWALEADDG